ETDARGKGRCNSAGHKNVLSWPWNLNQGGASHWWRQVNIRNGRLHQAQGAQPDHALLLVLPTQMKILPPARKSEAGSRQPRSICLFLSGMDEGLIIHVA